MSAPESKSTAEGFVDVDYPEPHRARGKDLLQEHPEIKELFGRNPWTAVICVALVAVDVALAAAMQSLPWWAMVLCAWGIGAFIAHCLFAIIHEAAHKRILRGRLGNEIVGWIANMPQLVPSASSFRNYHLKHHRYQGDPEFDADLASQAEADWVGNSTARKVIWQVFYPLFQTVRTAKFQKNGKIPFWTKYVVINAVVVFAFDAAIIYFAGWWAFAYLLLSLSFSLGLHPLSARLIQEHFVLHDDQETYSYYGPANKVSLNVFYHNEHHDFPAVAWNNLPKVTAIASDYYEDELYHHPSLTKLWLRFLLDPAVTLHRRIRRDYSNGTPKGSSRGRALGDDKDSAATPAAAE